jgi:hypothetical protein
LVSVYAQPLESRVLFKEERRNTPTSLFAYLPIVPRTDFPLF